MKGIGDIANRMNLHETCAICRDELEGALRDTFRVSLLGKSRKILENAREDTYFDGIRMRRTKMLRSARPISFKSSNSNNLINNNGAQTSIALLDSCIHLFHYECISRWAHRENSCVLCKEKFHRMAKITDKGDIEDIYKVPDCSLKINEFEDELSSLSGLLSSSDFDSSSSESIHTDQELESLANLSLPLARSSSSSSSSVISLSSDDSDEEYTSLTLRERLEHISLQ